MANGSASVALCPVCGGDNPMTARFCQHCGSRLDAPTTEQRKVVTVVFCDVTGSTGLGERLDPEVFRGVMGSFYDRACDVVRRHEGSVEKFIGDAVVAVFGVPVSREDDALRAVRAAAEIQDSIRTLAADAREQYGVELAIRSGVNTGEVVVGDARAGGSFATGDAVNTAARLEQAAGPGETVLGGGTYRLVADAVDADPLPPQRLRGKEVATEAFLLRAVREAPGAKQDTPFVGRVRERGILSDALSRVIESQTAALVTVLGDAGLGKSRLVGDVLGSAAGDATVLRGRCLSYGEGITFWPIVEVLRAATGLNGAGPADVVVERLTGLVADHPDAGAVAAQLGPLLGAGGEPGRLDDVAWAVQTVVEHLAEKSATVLDIDDVHWAEPALLDLLESVLRTCRDLPLLVVCQARPEFLTDRPSWGSGLPNVTTVRLEPLSDADAADLVTKVSNLDPVAAGKVMVAAGGNPLYLEHLVAHVREASDGSGLLGVPPTLAALLAARLDQLSEHERETVACAAIVGEVFQVSEVDVVSDLLTEKDVRPALELLSDRQIVRRSRQDGRNAYRFRHVLVQDAAYNVQPKRQRAERHRRYAAWLAAHPSEAAGELEAIRGWHLEQAHRLLNDVAPREAATAAVAAEAADSLALAASTRALADPAAASNLLLRAGEHTAEPRLRAERLLRAGSLRAFATDSTLMRSILAGIGQTKPPFGSGVHALADAMRLAHAARTETEVEAASASAAAGAALEACRREGWTWGLALAHAFSAEAANLVGDWAQVVAHTREVARLGAETGDKAMEAGARIQLVVAARWGTTPIPEALALADELVDSARDAPATRAMALMQKSALLAMNGDFDAAFDLLGPSPPEEHSVLSRFYGFCALSVYEAAGDLIAAAERGMVAAELAAAQGSVAHSSTLDGWAASLLGDAGEIERARETMRRARDQTPRDDAASQSNWRVAASQVAAADGDRDAARRHIDGAIAWMDRTDQLNDRARVRRLAARVLQRLGDTARARQLLTEAHEMFEAKGNKSMTRRCAEELATLG